MSYQPKVYREQGGDKLVVASGGEIEAQSGATIDAQAGSTVNIVGLGISVTEAGYIDGVTAGTAAASKAVVLDENKDVGDLRNLDVTNLDVGASGTAGSVDVFPSTASKGKLTISAADNTNDDAITITNAEHGQATTVTLPDAGLATSYLVQSTAALTAAEVDKLDISAQTETITEAGAVSVVKKNTKIDSSGGAYAITLAAPDATMLGETKIIEMTTAGNAVTMALTNVQGGSAATSASFDAVNETLVLVAGTNKWNVVGEIGVTLS